MSDDLFTGKRMSQKDVGFFGWPTATRSSSIFDSVSFPKQSTPAYFCMRWPCAAGVLFRPQKSGGMVKSRPKQRAAAGQLG